MYSVHKCFTWIQEKTFFFLPGCCSTIHVQDISKVYELDKPNYFGSIYLYLRKEKFNKKPKWCGVNKAKKVFCLEFFSGKWVIRHIVRDGEFDDQIYFSSSRDAKCPTGSDVSGSQKLGWVQVLNFFFGFGLSYDFFSGSSRAGSKCWVFTIFIF